MAVTQYVGARYVPKFAEPLDWNKNSTYEALTIVYYQGNSYTSRQSIPSGIDIHNSKYWALTGNYNAQIEAYRKEAEKAVSVAQSAEMTANKIKSQVSVNSADINFLKEKTTQIANSNNIIIKDLRTQGNAIQENSKTLKNHGDSIYQNSQFINSMSSDLERFAVLTNKNTEQINKNVSDIKALQEGGGGGTSPKFLSYHPEGKMAIYGDSWAEFDVSYVGNFGESIKKLSGGLITYKNYGKSGGTLHAGSNSIQTAIKNAPVDKDVKYAVLVGGINDTSGSEYSLNASVQGFLDCIYEIRKKNPNAVIYTAIGNGLPPTGNFWSVTSAINLNHVCANVAANMSDVKTLNNTLTWFTMANEKSLGDLMDARHVHINQTACDKYFGKIIYQQLEKDVNYLNDYTIQYSYDASSSLGASTFETKVSQFNNTFTFKFYGFPTEVMSGYDKNVWGFVQKYTIDNPKNCVLALFRNGMISAASRIEWYDNNSNPQIKIDGDRDTGVTRVACYTAQGSDIGVRGTSVLTI